jgi:hypothetical protein
VCWDGFGIDVALHEKKLYFYGVIFKCKVMATQVLSKEVSDKLSFISFIIPKFASGYKMGIQEAYFYLKEYGGWDFLYECWWALHTDNPVWAIRDMAQGCRNIWRLFKMIVYHGSYTLFGIASRYFGAK